MARGKGAPPTQVAFRYLATGTGDRVRSGSSPLVRYVQADWKTGDVSHDSWGQHIEKETLPIEDATISVSQYLGGIPLGSRLEIVNPTGGGDAHVFVVDLIEQN